MPSSATVAKTYKSLVKKEIKLSSLSPFTQWLPRKLLPGIRFHWNAIWHHRLAMEIACQFSENGDYGTFLTSLEKYYKEYGKLYSTMPLCSNKSISHYIGQCALDALLKKVNEKNITTLDEAFSRVSKDGAFTEGGHYSQFVIDCFDRVGVLFDNWFGVSDNKILQDSYVHLSNNMGKVKKWQRRITDEDGVMAVIGDGWHEKIIPGVEDGVFYYEDMTIYRESNWLVIKNHRQNPFSLHQHPHGDEILIAHKNDWLIKGSGMPSYKHVMRKPWKWRRPRNHFFTESWLDWWILWRYRVSWSKDKSNSRMVDINDTDLDIFESGKKTVRLPGIRTEVIGGLTSPYIWWYGKFKFLVDGINIKLRGADHAHVATTYNNEEKIPVVRISGENLKIRISVNDREETNS